MARRATKTSQGTMDTSSKITERTRSAAYQSVLPFAHNRQEGVFECLRAHAPGGMTAGEIAEEMSHDFI